VSSHVPRRHRFKGETNCLHFLCAVVAIARIRTNHRCEVPACEHPVFVCDDGRTYSEVHHIVPLAEGGEDVPANMACVCPAHHREAHVGAKAEELGQVLKALRAGDGPDFDGATTQQQAQPCAGTTEAPNL